MFVSYWLLLRIDFHLKSNIRSEWYHLPKIDDTDQFELLRMNLKSSTQYTETNPLNLEIYTVDSKHPKRFAPKHETVLHLNFSVGVTYKGVSKLYPGNLWGVAKRKRGTQFSLIS